MKAQLANIALGLWLMVAPAVLEYGQPAADGDHIVGPIVASLATIAIWDVTRSLGRLNLPFGLWLLVAPLVLGYPLVAAVNSLIVGICIVTLSVIQGPVRQRFGGGWSALWHGNRLSAGNRD